MSKLLDEVKIKINMKISGNLLAIVTLSFNDEIEIRFNRLTIRENNTFWFQPPSLMQFGYRKCFAVPNHDEWIKLERKVIDQFLQEVEDKKKEGLIPPAFLNKLKAISESEVTEDDWNKIEQHTD